MPHYAVRITHSYEVAKPIVHLWAMKCEKNLAYEHLGERTGKIHIHLLLVNTSVDKQLRNIAATTKSQYQATNGCRSKSQTWSRHILHI